LTILVVVCIHNCIILYAPEYINNSNQTMIEADISKKTIGGILSQLFEEETGVK
jgi:hypothetical protein